jgi:hypothetical protein
VCNADIRSNREGPDGVPGTGEKRIRGEEEKVKK